MNNLQKLTILKFLLKNPRKYNQSQLSELYPEVNIDDLMAEFEVSQLLKNQTREINTTAIKPMTYSVKGITYQTNLKYIIDVIQNPYHYSYYDLAKKYDRSEKHIAKSCIENNVNHLIKRKENISKEEQEELSERVINLVKRTSKKLTLSEISEKLNLPRDTVNRIVTLKNLEAYVALTKKTNSPTKKEIICEFIKSHPHQHTFSSLRKELGFSKAYINTIVNDNHLRDLLIINDIKINNRKEGVIVNHKIKALNHNLDNIVKPVKPRNSSYSPSPKKVAIQQKNTTYYINKIKSETGKLNLSELANKHNVTRLFLFKIIYDYDLDEHVCGFDGIIEQVKKDGYLK